MSMLLMVKAMQTKVGNPLRKLVLIKLADNANDMGECWPSHQHVADQCEISKTSVRNHIKKLEEMGLLKIEHREGPKGNSSNLYHLTLQGVPNDGIGIAGDGIGGIAGDGTRTSHSFEPVKEPVNVPSKMTRKDYPEEFEWIWERKPNREGGNPKKQAYSACKARIKEGTTWSELAEGLIRYSKYCHAKGLIGTPMVQQMATFFGTKESFKESWSYDAANQQTINATSNRKLTAEEERNAELLRKYGNANSSSEWAVNQPSDTGVDKRQVQRGIYEQVEQEGATIDLDSGDWSSND